MLHYGVLDDCETLRLSNTFTFIILHVPGWTIVKFHYRPTLALQAFAESYPDGVSYELFGYAWHIESSNNDHVLAHYMISLFLARVAERGARLLITLHITTLFRLALDLFCRRCRRL